AHLVPAHPIAGNASQGVDAADGALYEKRLVLLTPYADTPARATAAVAEMWTLVGARAERISAPNHDIIYAYISHLPQLLAFAACHTLARTPFLTAPQPAEIFADFTRLGGSPAHLWSGI